MCSARSATAAYLCSTTPCRWGEAIRLIPLRSSTAGFSASAAAPEPGVISSRLMMADGCRFLCSNLRRHRHDDSARDEMAVRRAGRENGRRTGPRQTYDGINSTDHLPDLATADGA